jgi:hypothetical protein
LHQLLYYITIAYRSTVRKIETDQMTTVAEEGNRRVGDMTADEMEQCASGIIHMETRNEVKLM